MRNIVAPITAVLLMVLSNLGFAEPPGKLDYDRYCAGCHGVHGKGDGAALQVVPGSKPTDLTRLSATHGGQFPYDEVFQVIEGRRRISGHSDVDSNMPLWGLLFQTEGKEFSPESEATVKRRISDLVSYVQTLNRN